MNIETARPTAKNPPEQFAGDRDGNVFQVHPGQTLYTPPGQEHWHAAPPDAFMEHIALLEAGEDPATTTVWGEHITEEYNRR